MDLPSPHRRDADLEPHFLNAVSIPIAVERRCVLSRRASSARCRWCSPMTIRRYPRLSEPAMKTGSAIPMMMSAARALSASSDADGERNQTGHGRRYQHGIHQKQVDADVAVAGTQQAKLYRVLINQIGKPKNCGNRDQANPRNQKEREKKHRGRQRQKRILDQYGHGTKKARFANSCRFAAGWSRTNTATAAR